LDDGDPLGEALGAGLSGAADDGAADIGVLDTGATLTGTAVVGFALGALVITAIINKAGAAVGVKVFSWLMSWLMGMAFSLLELHTCALGFR
jgi:hypothetical protein